MVMAAPILSLPQSHRALLQSAARGVILMSSPSPEMVMKLHPCVYADTMACWIFTPNVFAATRSSTCVWRLSGASMPSNTERSASARTALLGQPIIGFASAFMAGGML
jgi:hypothetical protein